MCNTLLTSGLIGSISLLVCSITGPGMVLIPMIYQDGGYLFPTAIFLIVTLLSGISSLFVVESISRFPGNEHFQRNVEFTVLVHQFYGRKVYYMFLMILYASIQSTNIVSIIGSAQIFDSLFIAFFGSTCGYGIHPINGLYCVNQISNTNSPFGDNYMLCTFGLLIVALIIIPMTSIDLNDNMFLQFLSFAYNILFVLTLIFFAMGKGIEFNRVPNLPRDASQVVGQVLYNFGIEN
jgi:hypothetical protein